MAGRTRTKRWPLYPLSLASYGKLMLAHSLPMAPQAAAGNFHFSPPHRNFYTIVIFLALLMMDIVQRGETNKVIPIMPIAEQSE